ncbi:MAG: prepilin-type N-terminal cleavage/methylation domain-containing protein [Candidatus Omnitrophota bacterium]|jgi:prepilin-type N-terminal cleavage/methylation domain-containing protein
MRNWLRIYRKKNKTGSAGFTLVEVMIAATLFSVVGLGILTSFSSGMKLWNRAKQADMPKCELLLGFETVSRDLRQSMDIAKIGFEGDARSLSFPALASGKIVKMTYSFDPDGAILKAYYIALKDIDSLKTDENSIKKTLFKADELSFAYLYYDMDKGAYIWADSWKKEDGRFIAVKIQAKLKGNTFAKTIVSPIS